MPTTPRGQKLDLTGYSLVFEDEFNGTELNTDVWEYRGSGPRRGGFNGESQVKVENGNMILSGEYLTDGEYGEGWYTGMVKLRERYCKGYFEIRCIVNNDSGFWSAFWIQADSPYTASVSKGGVGGAEIDIFESMSYDNAVGKNSVCQTIHCAGVDGVQEGFQSERLGYFYGSNIYEEYNTYGLEWTEDEYIFYINGVETRRSSFGNGVSQVPEDVIVSLEIPEGDKLSGIDKETYQTDFIVDYVRIYQK
jgi:beta-glucanase (GH16 family)